MATTVVYATAASDGLVKSVHADYQTARQSGTLSVDTSDDYIYVGQWWVSGPDTAFWLYEGLLYFDTSGVTGTVDTMDLGLYMPAALGAVTDPSALNQPFTLNIRAYDYGGSITTADWVGGGSCAANTLYASLATTDMANSSWESLSLAALEGIAAPDSVSLLLTSNKFEGGEPIDSGGTTTKGYVSWYAADYTGTTYDPKLTIVDGANPTDCTINAPAFGSYDGTIDLTATATDPNGGTIVYAWDYSTDGGANWSACANSPSAAVASGDPGTITFATSVVAQGAEIDLRVRAYDGANYSFNYVYVTIARNSQTDVLIYRTAGADVMAYPASGTVISRPVSGTSRLTFTIDNYDAAAGSIADDDELVLYVPYYPLGAIGSYSWRGFVRELKVGDLVEVVAEDISYRFAKTRVTRTITSGTVGSVVKAIVEDPTGSHATGITATCAEVDDPLNPGNYLMMSNFAGQNRYLSDWLAEFSEWTGCQWYVYHDGSDWQFVWFDPSANSAWGFACLDSIDFANESTSQARMTNRPSVTKSRYQYANRVWYYTDAAYTLASVETAEVTAETEEPEEVTLTTVAVDATAAESMAQAYLDAYSQTLTTIDQVQIHGIRDIDLDCDVTLTLASRGISATDYPLAGIEYRLLDSGNKTVLTLGDKAANARRGVDRLMRRIAELQADVRA